MRKVLRNDEVSELLPRSYAEVLVQSGPTEEEVAAACEAGGSAVARFTGSIAFLFSDPGACAPGFMLPPASQARSWESAFAARRLITWSLQVTFVVFDSICL